MTAAAAANFSKKSVSLESCCTTFRFFKSEIPSFAKTDLRFFATDKRHRRLGQSKQEKRR